VAYGDVSLMGEKEVVSEVVWGSSSFFSSMAVPLWVRWNAAGWNDFLNSLRMPSLPSRIPPCNAPSPTVLARLSHAPSRPHHAQREEYRRCGSDLESFHLLHEFLSLCRGLLDHRLRLLSRRDLQREPEANENG
jgi:hypothetical protein